MDHLKGTSPKLFIVGTSALLIYVICVPFVRDIISQSSDVHLQIKPCCGVCVFSVFSKRDGKLSTV